MKKTKAIIKGILMSVITIGVGFIALALPFRIFTSLPQEAMHVLFITELTIYVVTGMTFLFIKGKNEKEKERNEERRRARRAKFEQAQKEYYDLAA